MTAWAREDHSFSSRDSHGNQLSLRAPLSSRSGRGAGGEGQKGSTMTTDQPNPNGDQPALNVRQVPADALTRMDDQIEQVGGEWQPAPEDANAVGRTMFDTPSSEDNTVTVLLPRETMSLLPSQALVRIESRGDKRTYLGIVVSGPFAEPDGLRADAPLVVTTTVRGGLFLPKYHGRVQVEILGERLDDALVPPRFRPLPNSPVFALNDEETADVLNAVGDLPLGLAVGHEELRVYIPTDTKAVLPRHTGILGTTGGGKSTTVSRLIAGTQRAKMAVIVLDVEGEYTTINQPTGDPQMLAALKRRGLEPWGVRNTRLLHLVGRETANPDHPNQANFSLAFGQLSPWAISEILDLTDAQQTRFWRVYDLGKKLLRDLGIFPRPKDIEQEREALEFNEFETGYPCLTLSHVLDIASLYLRQVNKSDETPRFSSPDFRERASQVMQAVEIDQKSSKTDNESSWRALLGKLHRLRRLGVFDSTQSPPLNYGELLRPGQVTIIDLSDSDSPQVNNLVIADLLRGVQDAQDGAYRLVEQGERKLTPVLLVIEEAHEFLSKERIEKMPVLFEQVARIAKRGRKRWLGLVFVTQLPQHLPRQVFGLINNVILHRITDAQTVSLLQDSFGSIDRSLWRQIPGLAPGQAVVSFTHLTRPLLVAVDPTPCQLRLVD